MITIYALVSHDDRVLYVGATTNPANRLSNHRCRQPWAAEIREMQTLAVVDRRHPIIGAIVEEAFIRALRPSENKRSVSGRALLGWGACDLLREARKAAKAAA